MSNDSPFPDEIVGMAGALRDCLIEYGYLEDKNFDFTRAIAGFMGDGQRAERRRVVHLGRREENPPSLRWWAETACGKAVWSAPNQWVVETKYVGRVTCNSCRKRRVYKRALEKYGEIQEQRLELEKKLIDAIAQEDKDLVMRITEELHQL